MIQVSYRSCIDRPVRVSTPGDPVRLLVEHRPGPAVVPHAARLMAEVLEQVQLEQVGRAVVLERALPVGQRVAVEREVVRHVVGRVPEPVEVDRQVGEPFVDPRHLVCVVIVHDQVLELVRERGLDVERPRRVGAQAERPDQRVQEEDVAVELLLELRRVEPGDERLERRVVVQLVDDVVGQDVDVLAAVAPGQVVPEVVDVGVDDVIGRALQVVDLVASDLVRRTPVGRQEIPCDPDPRAARRVGRRLPVEDDVLRARVGGVEAGDR